MSIFTRFTDIVNSNLHSLLEKAEDPEKMIKYIIQEMDEALVDVRSAAAKCIAEKKSQQRILSVQQTALEKWQEKAELALIKNRDDLAKLALIEKQKILKEIESITLEISSVDNALTAIQADSQRLNDKLNEAKAKQQTLLLRKEAANSRLKLREKTAGYDIDSTLMKFELYEQKIERIEAEVEAYDVAHPKSLNDEFDALKRDSAIEDELIELKEKLAS